MNPLRIDPTRTTMLRRKFSIDMNKRFARLKQLIRDLVQREDAFGWSLRSPSIPLVNEAHKFSSTHITLRPPLRDEVLTLTHRIDPEDLTDRGLETDPHITVKYGLHTNTAKDVQTIIESHGPIFGIIGASSIFRGEKFDVVKIDVDSPALASLHRDLTRALPNTETHTEYRPHITIAYVKTGMGQKYVGWLDLWKRQFTVDSVIFSDKDRNQIPIPLLGNQILAVNTRWRFQTHDQQLASFLLWLQNNIDGIILQKVGEGASDVWLSQYIKEAYAKGMGRAFDDVRKPALWTGVSPTDTRSMDFFKGTRTEFLRQSFSQPASIERVRLLASRALTDLQGVTNAMAQQIGKELVDGMIQGLSPREVADNMVDRVDSVGKSRALTIARTETVRAHNEGALDAMELMGISEVNVMVEWSTAEDGRVCPECKPLDGIVIKIQEAHGMLPRHPNCRCSFIPANVGESKTGQKRTKTRIDEAITKSVKAEHPKKTPARARKLSRWTGVDVSISKRRPKGIL